MYRYWVALALTFFAVLIVTRCVELWMRFRATAGATVVHDEASAALALHSHGDAEESYPRGDQDRILSTPQERTCVGWRSGELKVTSGARAVSVGGVHGEPFADLFFKMDCNTSGRHTKVLLALDQVDLGIKNCCTQNFSSVNQSCNGSCSQLFIHKMTIQLCPRSWAHHCHRMQVEPHLMSEVFVLQRNSSLSFQMPILSPKQVSVIYETGNTVYRVAPSFSWAPASRDDSTNSVTWTWELSRCIDGSKLEFNRSKWGPMPKLGIQASYMTIHPGSFVVEASWEVLPNEAMQQQLEWDMKLSLHTALLQKKRYLGVPRYSIRGGPAIPFEKLLTFQ